MKKFLNIMLAGAAMTALAGTAQAQESGGAHAYVGAEVGYHDLGVDRDAFPPLTLDDSAMIYGGYAGVDFDLAPHVVIGAEGNFNLGNSAIDSEYGVAGRLGYRTNGNSIIFARVGYQWVNLDVAKFTGVTNPPAGIDDTIDDVLFGVGADVALGRNMHLRLAADTITFDSVRGTAGIGFRF